MDLKKLTVKEINNYLDNDNNLSADFLAELKNDHRLTVRKLYDKIQQLKVMEEQEKKRLYQLFSLERKFWGKGCEIVAGVDEAGRGPLAGPVVAAAVVFRKMEFIAGLNDSKKVSETKRNVLVREILKKALYWQISIVDHHIIDEINIRQASFKAMEKAVTSLSKQPEIVLVDGFAIPNLANTQVPVIKGDQYCASIAAASILAKCTRDRLMLYYHQQYPWYRFDLHKGYGTKIHYEAINIYGSSPIHRKTFLD